MEIIQTLTQLNTKLQGKCVFADELHLEVKTFQWKLGLLAKQLKEHNIVRIGQSKTQCYTRIIRQVQFPADGFTTGIHQKIC